MVQPLTFGFLYDLRNPEQWRRPWTDIYSETLDFITWTEGLGYEYAWVPEHHVSADGFAPSPLIVLSAIAARTSRIRIGSAVALAPLHHPVRFAQDCAVIDTIANGRLEVGVALGYRRLETDAYGIDFRTRASRMEEFLEIVPRLWAGETITFEGRHFNLKNAFINPAPPRGHIPLLIGGYSTPAMDRVVKYGDGYMGGLDLGQLYFEKLRAAGRNPALGRFVVPSMTLAVSHDPEKAMEELAPYFHYVNNLYGAWLTEDGFDTRVEVSTAPRSMSLEEFKASGLLNTMTPSQAIDLFRRMGEQSPLHHVMMMVPPGIPLSRFAPYAETFANEVMPAFRL